MKSNKKLVDESISIEEKKEKISNAQTKSSMNPNTTKKTFPSSQKNFKPKQEKDKESLNNIPENQQNNNLNVF